MASTTPALLRTTEVTDFFGENSPDVYVLFEMFVYLFTVFTVFLISITKINSLTLKCIYVTIAWY